MLAFPSFTRITLPNNIFIPKLVDLDMFIVMIMCPYWLFSSTPLPPWLLFIGNLHTGSFIHSFIYLFIHSVNAIWVPTTSQAMPYSLLVSIRTSLHIIDPSISPFNSINTCFVFLGALMFGDILLFYFLGDLRFLTLCNVLLCLLLTGFWLKIYFVCC